MDTNALVTSHEGIMAILCSICMIFFYWEKRFAKIFAYLPAIVLIYLTPILLTNTGIIPAKSPVYDFLKAYILPMFISIMLLEIDIRASFRLIGRSLGVMICCTFGVVLGGVVSFLVFHRWLSADAWKGFGALTASWIGGTGNMAAVSGSLATSGETMGLVILVDSVVYSLWLPVLLAAKNYSEPFNKFTHYDATSQTIAPALSTEQTHYQAKSKELESRHFIYLLAIGFLVTWVANLLAARLPEFSPVLTTASWKILLVTTLSLALSFTPAQKIPGSRSVAMGLLFIFMASMGATATLSDLGRAPVFLAAGLLWITIHGVCCVIGARLFHVSLAMAATCSAANVGAIASASVIASAHEERLIPIGIVMALIGYSLANYLGILAASICYACR